MNQHSLNLDIEHIQKAINDTKADIEGYKKTLHLADIATLLMLFVFLVGFYVSDPFHLASFVSEKIQNEAVELLVYALLLVMAAIMAITIARLKRSHYEHKAKYRAGGSVWKVAIVIMVFTVFAEIYNATGNQQHSQFAKAEGSKSFSALVGQKVEIASSNGASLLPKLQGDLAEAESYLKGCKKTCSSWQAKTDKLRAQIAALEAGEKNAAAAASAAAEGAANAMAANLQKLKEDYLHPMVKMLGSFGISAPTAMMLIAALVAIAFERMHLSASENLRDCFAQLESLEQSLLNKRKELALLTGGLSPALPADAVGVPSGVPPIATPAPVARFRYQQPEPVPRPIGFAAWEPTKADPSKAVTPKGGVLGTNEVQLAIPEISTYRAEPVQAGIPSHHDPAMKPQVIARGCTTPPPCTVHGQQDASAGTSGARVSRVPYTGEEGMQAMTEARYAELVQRVLAGEVKPTFRPVKEVLRGWGIGKRDSHRQEIASELLDRMYADGVLKLNPANDGTGIRKAKYVLA